MKQKQRQTFQQICEASRQEAAEAVWQRASQASRLRHIVVTQGRRGTARRLSILKLDAIRHVLELKPESVRVGIDSDYQIGLVSIRWPGYGMLHLPANTERITSFGEGAMALMSHRYELDPGIVPARGSPPKEQKVRNRT